MPTRPLLYATDLRPQDDDALRSAAALAHALGASIEVFHSVATPPWPLRPEPAALDRALAALDAQRLRTGCADVLHASHIAIGAPAQAIRQRAEAIDAALIVLGPHRPRTLLDAWRETTAEQILRATPRPCLLLQRPLPCPPRRVILAADLTDRAHALLSAALAWLAPLALAAGQPIRVDLLHVHQLAFSGELEAAGELRRLESALEQITAACHAPPGVHLWPRLLSAEDPAEGLLQACERERADLLIIGGRTPSLAGALLGSVAATIVRQSASPVLLWAC